MRRPNVGMIVNESGNTVAQQGMVVDADDANACLFTHGSVSIREEESGNPLCDLTRRGGVKRHFSRDPARPGRCFPLGLIVAMRLKMLHKTEVLLIQHARLPRPEQPFWRSKRD